jgi:cytochrome c biogenesis protein CcdA/thiol-disulfide isomerase/thioredoxin
MSLTFSLFSALAIVGGEWISQANEVGRILAMALLTVFALSLIFPHLSEKMLEPFTRIGSKISSDTKGDSVWGSFVIGISTGLLWAPCAGPILGLVLTGAASQGNTAASIGLLFSYSLGAATSLALALVAGNRFLGTLKKFLGVDRVVKKGLGIAVLLGVAAIAFKLDRTLLTQVSKFETVSIENILLKLIAPEQVAPATVDSGSTPLPDLTGAIAWLNSKPLSKDDLRGKVVLIDFWTYSCINCLRTLPYVKAWAEKYAGDGLVVIGVHTPEFAFEKSLSNVESAVRDLGIKYPVAVDSDYKIWKAFSNHDWPSHYFVDREGLIRSHHSGEGDYDQSEKEIRDLLAEGGHILTAGETKVQATGREETNSLEEVESPETYLGYGRSEGFASSPMALHDQIANYTPPQSLDQNQWALEGKWLVSEEKATAKDSPAKIRFRFHARDLNLVLGGSSHTKFVVRIDGHVPGQDHGVDVDQNGNGEIDSHRLYQLIRQENEKTISDHVFEIEFAQPEVEAYAFTFG